MAELTYRDAVAAGIAQELERDERVLFFGEDVAAAGGVARSKTRIYTVSEPSLMTTRLAALMFTVLLVVVAETAS